MRNRLANPAPTWLPLAAVAVTLLLWASAFVGIRHLGDDFSPGALALGRLLVGSVALAPLALRHRFPRLTRRQLVAVVVVGMLWFGVYNVALNEAERRVDAGTASILIQVSPVLVGLLAASVLGERFTRNLVLGSALAFGGVVLIGLGEPTEGSRDWLGVVLCLVAAVSYAVSLVVQKPLVATLAAVQVTWLACTVGAIACLPFTGQLVDQVQQGPASSTDWMVYLGVFPTAIAFSTFAFALQHMAAARLAVTTYLVPPITIVLGVLLLDEAPPVLAYLGGALALLGVGIARRAEATAAVTAPDAPEAPDRSEARPPHG